MVWSSLDNNMSIGQRQKEKAFAGRSEDIFFMVASAVFLPQKKSSSSTNLSVPRPQKFEKHCLNSRE